MSAFKVGAGLMFLGISALAPITEQRPPAGGGATVKGVAAATAFLDTLDPSRRAKATLPLNKTTRTVWSNLPTGVTMQVGATERNGLKLGDMTPWSRRS